jgi:hypothetical protein
MLCRIARCKRGNGTVLAMLALLLVLAFGLSLTSISMTALTAGRSNSLRAKAIGSAEAGVDMAVDFLRGTAPDGSTDGSWRTSHPSANPDVHNGDTWYSGTLSSGETYRICVRDGSGVHAGKIIVTSEGTATEGDRSVTRTLKVALERRSENVNVWNNVIFGGVGQAGRSINGNVKIRGSVHLLGDGEEFTDVDADGHWDDAEPFTDKNGNSQYDTGEPYTDTDVDGHRDAQEPYNDINGDGMRNPPLTVTDLAEEISGTANVGNSYNGMTAGLKALLPSLPTTDWGGETVDTLSAKLRVKHGRVDVSGSATVGDPDNTGNSYKETINGAYVSDGYGGNKGASSVYADNGTANPYDLGDGVVRFPAVSDPYTAPDGTHYASYMAYLQANSCVVSGSLTLRRGTAYSVSNSKGSLTMDASGNMTITGIVYVDGDINFARNGTITYSGKGTLVSTDDIFVHCNVLPAVNFPRHDALGLLARDRVELATGAGDSQLQMAMAMYAQSQVVSAKQSEIAGTIVSSYYSMTNVPSIFQVPELVDNLPPGLPGGDPIWVVTIDVVSWAEI